MTGSIPDPRLEAAAERIRSGHWYPSEYEGSRSAEKWCRRAAAALIESIDAADEASGVRRVTGGFEARLMSLDFPTDQEVDDRGIDGLLATFDVPEGRKWPAGAYLIVPLGAADSPVGGVS